MPCQDNNKQLFEQAMTARDHGNLELAKTLCFEILKNLTETDRKCMAIVHLQLGYFYRKLQDLHTAEYHSRVSVNYAPRAELASLQLFHVLVRQDRWYDAMEEAVRYLSEKNSGEYRDMFTVERYGEEFDVPTFHLLQEARRLLQRHLETN